MLPQPLPGMHGGVSNGAGEGTSPRAAVAGGQALERLRAAGGAGAGAAARAGGGDGARGWGSRTAVSGAAEPLEGADHHVPVGGLPERWQRGPEIAAVASGRQPGVEDRHDAPVVGTAQEPPDPLGEE